MLYTNCTNFADMKETDVLIIGAGLGGLFTGALLAKEGLDIPRADRLFLVQPVRDATAIQQSVGRIMRPAPGKTDALVYDFVDILVPTCRNQFSARKTVYKKLNAKIRKEES